MVQLKNNVFTSLILGAHAKGFPLNSVVLMVYAEATTIVHYYKMAVVVRSTANQLSKMDAPCISHALKDARP